MNYTAVNVSPR